MLHRIEETIERYALLRAGDRVIVGVSGGADSVTLLYALHFLQQTYPRLALMVAHLNHLIRGDEAEADMEFVQTLAWGLSLPVVCRRIDVPARAAERGISLEMAAREARHDFFQEVLAAHGRAHVALAHTADDQAETVLLRLARGCGLQGLGGIPYHNWVRGMHLIRPLRDITHGEAVAFLQRHGLSWREDVSNADMRFLRNRVRHGVLPLLERHVNPQVRRAIVRTADILREENEWIELLTEELLSACAVASEEPALGLSKLRDAAPAAIRRVLLMWLSRNGVDPGELDHAGLSRLEALAAGTEGTQAAPLAGEWTVVRQYDRLFLREGTIERPESFRVALRVPGRIALPELGLAVTTGHQVGFVRQPGAGLGVLPAEAWFDRDLVVGGRLILRSWRPGDRIAPLDMNGSKKLQDLFVDAKIPRDERGLVPVLECRDEIIWVPGYQVAQGWEVKGEQEPSIHVRIERV